MSSDYIKNILIILYDEMTSRVYSILKTAQKMKKEDLDKKLKEEGHYEDLNPILGRLALQGFIITEQEKKTLPKEGVTRFKRGDNRIENIIFKNPSINVLKGPYEEMKRKLREEFKEKETKKLQCTKCGNIKSEYDASMTLFICPSCKIKYVPIGEDVANLRKKCEEIIEVLDELFKEEENNSNTEITRYYNDYLTAKFGKNFSNENNIEDVFEEDHESYINKTLDYLEKKDEKDKDKCNFYELVEGFIRAKKK